MKITDIIRLLIKLFSIFFLAYSLITILSQITMSITIGAELIYLISAAMQIVFMILVFWLLFFKTNWIIRILKLDQGYENDMIELKDSKKEPILDLAIVIVGGIVIVKYFPIFLSNLIFAFKASSGTNDVTDSYMTDMKIRIATNLLGIIIGYLLITNRRKLIKWIDKDNKEE